MNAKAVQGKVIVDFGEGSGLGTEQQALLEVLERQLAGKPLILSTSGRVGGKDVSRYNFLVTLKRVEQSQPVAV